MSDTQTVIRTNKLSGHQEELSLVGATIVLGNVLIKLRVDIEAELLAGSKIETELYEYQLQAKGKVA